jgi:hypothetical protein
MIIGQSKAPLFTLTAKVRLLPPDISKYQLLKYSWLKNKKKWRNNRRLKKKFLKNFNRYLPQWVKNEYNNASYYEKAMREIMEEEDNILKGLQ